MADREPSRLRRAVPVAAVLGAALAAVGALPVWIGQHYGTDRQAELTRTGLQAAPAVLPLAIVAVAGLVAGFAGRSWLRRTIGALLVVVGIGLVVVPLLLVIEPPADATDGVAGLPAAAELMGPVELGYLGPVLVVLGGLLVVAAGLALAVGPGPNRVSERYEAPVSRHQAAAAVAATGEVTDAEDAAAWWRAQDAGVDPTNGASGGDEGGVKTEGRGQLP